MLTPGLCGDHCEDRRLILQRLVVMSRQDASDVLFCSVRVNIRTRRVQLLRITVKTPIGCPRDVTVTSFHSLGVDVRSSCSPSTRTNRTRRRQACSLHPHPSEDGTDSASISWTCSRSQLPPTELLSSLSLKKISSSSSTSSSSSHLVCLSLRNAQSSFCFFFLHQMFRCPGAKDACITLIPDRCRNQQRRVSFIF